MKHTSTNSTCDAFSEFIGCKQEVNMLRRCADMIKRYPSYAEYGCSKLGGIMLFGEPGVGKTTLAMMTIKETGINDQNVFIIRRDKDDTKSFIEYLNTVCNAAMNCNGPSIILFDDINNYVSSERYSYDSPQEFSALQSAIDNFEGSNIYFIATANKIDHIPKSLIRSGRFDVVLEIRQPLIASESRALVDHFLSLGKQIDQNINLNDISRALTWSTGAEIQNILNQAGAQACYQNKPYICIEDISQAILKIKFSAVDYIDDVEKNKHEELFAAIHEAGHVVVAEVLENSENQEGAVDIVAIYTDRNHNTVGFTKTSYNEKNTDKQAKRSLAGSAATEVLLGECYCSASDLESARDVVMHGISETANRGFFSINYSTIDTEASNISHLITEIAASTELSRLYSQTKRILLSNWTFLLNIIHNLLTKRVLYHSDIERIRNTENIYEGTDKDASKPQKRFIK